MPDIVLATLNAKFIHASFGLRYLLANLGDLRPRAAIVEFEIKQTPLEVVESILALKPRIVGLGVYIWNVRPTLDVVALLKRIAPEVCVVLGGPEVSHETESQEIVRLADHTITGEADLEFARFCRCFLGIEESRGPLPKVLHAPLPDLQSVRMPYEEFTDDDIAHRVLYVEASRGCPFRCEFCLSSLDIPVRAFPLEPFLAAMRRLLDRGARQFKFVDRTFNLNVEVSRAILGFFREGWRDGLFLHFEMVPDRLPEALRGEIAWFHPGALQFEIGIQSFEPAVCARIQRRQDFDRTEENLHFLREKTGVHVHADLIAGLPGETLEGFGTGFDRLLGLGPQEIQVGILKKLRGTPIGRHDAEWDMRYSPFPPYEILSNRVLDFTTVQRLRRFARYWDLVANSGRFGATLPLMWRGFPSPFGRFLAFSDWLHAELGKTHTIALERLTHAIFRWLVERGDVPNEDATRALTSDWHKGGHRDLPPWLQAEQPAAQGQFDPPKPRAGRRRQDRHASGEKDSPESRAEHRP